MSRLLRKLLSRFLTLGVGGEDDNAGDPGSAPAAGDTEGATGGADESQAGQSAAGAGEDSFDDLLDLEDPAPSAPDPKAAAVAATARAERAERALADTVANRGAAAPQALPGVDPELARDEAQLQAARAAPGATPDSIAWAEWQIRSNRAMRESRRDSQQALAEAREIADKTSFDRLELTKPKLFKAYADRVEKTVAELRSKGQAVPPRAALLRFFLGDDMVNGKIKQRPAKAAADAQAPQQRVDRGRLPGARSDVRSRGPQSEHAKRIARLENQPI